MAVSATAVAPMRALRASEQFWLLTEVRWRSYRNMLRKSGVQRAKLLTAILTWVLAAVGGLGSAVAFFGLGYAAGSRSKPALLGLGALLIFGLWQLAPILFEATAPTVKFRDIARYPVAFRTFFALHVAYGLLDPSVIAGNFWLLAMWFGVLLARPNWGARAVVPFFLFSVTSLLANRFLLTLLDRVLSTRRGRESVLIGIAFLGISAQITFYGIVPRYSSIAGVKRFVERLLPLWTWSPPGIASWDVSAAWSKYIAATAVMALYSGVAALLLRWQLKGVFCGEIYSESRRRSGAVQMRPGWSLPFLSDAMSNMVEKELRYLLRDARTVMNAAMPVVFSIVIAIGRGAVTKAFSVGLKVQTGADRLQVMFSAATVFVLAYIAYNCFGLEGAGFQRWPMSPVRFRQVIVAKNIAIAMLWAISLTAVNIVLSLAGNYSVRLLGLCLLGLLYAGLVILAAGNQFSVRLPLKVDPAAITSNNMNTGTMLGNMLVGVMLVAMAWLGVAVGRWYERPWLTPLIYFALACGAALLYVASLRNAARYLETNVDKVADELE